LSIFNRIAAIENKIDSLEGRLSGASGSTPGGKSSYVKPTQAQGVSFENLIHSLADEEKFQPGSSPGTSAAQQMNSASVKPLVSEAASKYNLDPALIEAVIKQESSYNATARSHCGAEGLMQLMPETAKELGVENSLDPRQNVMGGAKYLRRLMDQFDGNLTKVIAGYNAGPGAVSHYGGVPPYTETQDYVGKVLKNYEEFKS
jgi:soluble lytic murein transglycosylase-like protein